jgi:hypothetical protein
METQLQKRLERLKNYATRYELALTRGNESYLVVYTSRRNRAGILAAIRDRAKRIVEITKSENLVFAKRAADGAMVGEWKLYFTGRTQREAYLNGTLPFIGTDET